MAAKPPTASQRKRWGRLCDLGCIVCTHLGYRDTPAGIHHCETGAGGRKDHDKVLPLCHHHHQGVDGIHSLSRETWQRYYGTEQFLMKCVAWMLGEIKDKPSNGGLL